MKTSTSGQGRKKGTPNRVTKAVREAIARLAESTVDQVAGWLTTVAADDPAKALDLWLKMIEYHIPKLARTEMTGKDGGPMVTEYPKLNIILHKDEQ